jgi:hypothetical protein
MEFFGYAEVFAALVKLEFVSIPGAVTTISTLLQKPENRSAAITMLGKTVELCLPLLKEKCDVVQLNNLRLALYQVSIIILNKHKRKQKRTSQIILIFVLLQVTESFFAYDIKYVCENMGWPIAPETAHSIQMLEAQLHQSTLEPVITGKKNKTIIILSILGSNSDVFQRVCWKVSLLLPVIPRQSLPLPMTPIWIT